MSSRPRSLLGAAVVAAGILMPGVAVRSLGAQSAPAAVPATAPATADGAVVPGLDSTPAAPGRAALIGRVHTAGAVQIADAELTLLSDAGRADAARGSTVDGRSVRTGPGGAFRLDSILPGRYFVRARRLGFAPLYFSATLDRGKTRRIDVELSPLATRVAAVDVRGESGYGSAPEQRFRDFELRRNIGIGRFFTRDDLKPFEGRTLADALRYLAATIPPQADFSSLAPFTGLGCTAGTYSTPSGFAFSGYGIYRGRAARSICVSLNGRLPIAGDVAFDWPVSSVEALEVYGRVLVVWTGAESD